MEPVMNQTQRLTLKLKAFTKLQRGWSYGDGIPIPEDVVDRCESIVIKAEKESLQAEVFPGLDGFAAVSLYLANPQGEMHAIEVVVSPDTKYSVHVERGIGFDFTHLVSGEGFTELDAMEMVEAWIDNVRSGRSHTPAKPIELV